MQDQAVGVINEFGSGPLLELLEPVSFREFIHVLENFVRFVIAEELTEELEDARIGGREVGPVMRRHPAVLTRVEYLPNDPLNVLTSLQTPRFHLIRQSRVSGGPGGSRCGHRLLDGRFTLLGINIDCFNVVDAKRGFVMKRVVDGVR